MKYSLFLAGTLIFILVNNATAQERWPRWYVGLSGFVPFVSEADVSGATSGDMDFQVGWGGAFSVGYMPAGGGSFLDGMRFDLEYSYRTNSIDTLSGVEVSDDISSNAILFNAYYDFTTGTKWVPYLGLGMGAAQLELNVPTLGIEDENDTVFAYQLMAGLGYAPQLMPRTVFSLGYRYFGASDPNFSGTVGSIETEYDTHNVEFGARFAF